MRILFTSQEFDPSGGGGISTYVRVLGEALVRAGHDVHVLVVRAGEAERTENHKGIHVHLAPLRRPRGVGRVLGVHETWHRLTLAANVALAIARLDLKPDVIETPEFGAEGLLLRRPHHAVRLHGAAHHVFPFTGRVGWDHRRAAHLEDWSARRAPLVLAPAAYLATERARLRLEPARVEAVPLPVRRPTPSGSPPVPGRIAFFGRFERRKGPATLVRALPLVRERVPDAHLVLTGRDTEDAGRSVAASLRALAVELGVADVVSIRDGWATPAEVVEAMEEAAVVAVPSAWESFGYVAAEASSLGRPVVASAVPGLDEVVVHGTTGTRVPPDDLGAWVKALVTVLCDPDLAAAWGQAGARHVTERFDPDRVAAATVAAYGRLLR